MRRYRIIRKRPNDAFWTIQRKVWWGWKYDSYAIHAKAALDYVDAKIEEENK